MSDAIFSLPDVSPHIKILSSSSSEGTASSGTIVAEDVDFSGPFTPRSTPLSNNRLSVLEFNRVSFSLTVPSSGSK